MTFSIYNNLEVGQKNGILRKENRDKILRKRLNLIKFVKNDDHISISALIFTICFLRF